MRLLSLSLSNFLSHESTKLEFNENDKLLIDGVSGSGKSSIAEALIWALYGIGRVDSKNLISHGKKGASVNASFLDGQNTWRIVRSITPKGSQSLDISCDRDGVAVPLSLTSLKEKQAFIEKEIIRSSYELFVNSVAYPQDKAGSFVSLPPAGRKDLLMEIIGAADLDEWAEKVKFFYSEADKDLSGVVAVVQMTEAAVKGAEDALKALEDSMLDPQIVAQEVEKAEKATREQEKKVEALESELKPLLGQAAEARVLDRDMAALSRAIPLPVAPPAIPYDTAPYEEAIANTNRLIIEAMKAPVDSKCLKCGEPWHKAVEDKNRRVEELSADLARAEKALETYKKGYESMSRARTEGFLAATAEATKREEERQKTLADKKAVHDLVKDAAEKAKAKEEEIRKEKGWLQIARDSWAAALNKHTRIQADLETKARSEKSLQELRNHLEGSRKVLLESEQKVADLKLLKDAFGANGIKVVVIEHLLPTLEMKINEVLSELSDFRVKLDTQRAGAKEGSLVDGLFITIVNGQGAELDFDGYSGGEKLKIVVAISEALATLQKAEFRIIDELFSGLDPDSTEKFAEVLLKIQERFGQLLVISHLPEIKSMFDKKVTVTKKDGVSTVV